MHHTSSQTQCPVNWDEGLTRVAGNAALFQKLLLRIAGDLPGDLAKMEEALINSDWGGLSTIAHTLKGSAGNLSITSVYMLSIDLEGAAKEEDGEKVAEVLLQLREKSDEYISYVNTL